MLYVLFWVISRRRNFIYRGTHYLFHLHRWVGMKNGWGLRKLGYFYGKKFGSKIAWANGKEGDSVRVGSGTQQVVKDNDPYEEIASVGVSHGMVQVKLLCSRWVPPTFSNQSFYTYWPMKMEQSVPKRRHKKFRRRGNYPEESILHSEQGESLKSRVSMFLEICSLIKYFVQS
jgi:hypothetical protein